MINLHPIALMAVYPDGQNLTVTQLNDTVLVLEAQGWNVKIVKRSSELQIRELLRSAVKVWKEFGKN